MSELPAINPVPMVCSRDTKLTQLIEAKLDLDRALLALNAFDTRVCVVGYTTDTERGDAMYEPWVQATNGIAILDRLIEEELDGMRKEAIGGGQ